jgi:ribosomal protein S17E
LDKAAREEEDRLVQEHAAWAADRIRNRVAG